MGVILDISGNNKILLLQTNFEKFCSQRKKTFEKTSYILPNFFFPISKCAMSYSSQCQLYDSLLQQKCRNILKYCYISRDTSGNEHSMPLTSNVISKALFSSAEINFPFLAFFEFINYNIFLLFQVFHMYV